MSYRDSNDPRRKAAAARYRAAMLGTPKHDALKAKKRAVEAARRAADPQLTRRNHLRINYGLTVAQYDALMRRQGGQCAICRARSGDSAGRRLAVDHDHNTGHVRGLLCAACNTGVAKLKDGELFMSALRYLRGFSGPMSAEERKTAPIGMGFLGYFPRACLAVANCSYVGNNQHNPGRPLAWDRSKSADEADALVRHLLDAGSVDSDGVRHSTKMAWRAMAFLQKELETADEWSGGARPADPACGESLANLRTGYGPCQKIATKLKAPKCRPNR